MSPLSTTMQWTIKTMSGALLDIFDTHYATVQRVEECQVQTGADSAWFTDLNIRRGELKV